MKIQIFILFFILNINYASCQKILKGKVYLDQDIGYVGLYIYDNSNLSSFAITDIYGAYAIEITDSSDYLIISSCSSTSPLFKPSGGTLYQKIKLPNKNVLDLIYSKEISTFESIPKSVKIRNTTDSTFKYSLKYNRHDTLKIATLKNINDSKTKYKYEFKYFDSFIQVLNYIYNNEKREYFYLSKIIFKYDMNGAIREKTVSVEYGSHHDFSQTIYYYEKNKVNKIEMFLTENLVNESHVVYDTFKLDKLTQIVQNEILRKKYYKPHMETDFKFDYKFIEINKE